jgi:hypothetical protein
VRMAEWEAPMTRFTRGWLARYAALVTSAHTGAVLDVTPTVRSAPARELATIAVGPQ